MTANNSFPFIVSSGPKLQNDPSIRAVIRKQAMKDVGKSRRGVSGRNKSKVVRVADTTTDVSIRCETSSESSRESSTTASSDSSSTLEDNDYDEFLPRQSAASKWKSPAGMRTQDPFSFAAISLFSDYETARSKFQIDIIDLTMLTNFHVGQSTIRVLAGDRANLVSLLGYRQWSYLAFVPSRYGKSDCVTAATNCVLGKVKSILAPQQFKHHETMLFLYSKALKTLQDAISDESSCLDADVLCATQLLSLHELLDPSRDSAWAQHINGSARLVKNRTPRRFETEFEKALFAAHVGPALTQALVHNTHCYLEQPEWTELYQTLIHSSKYLHDRSPLTIDIRSTMFMLPGVWHDTTVAINGPELFDDDALSALKVRSMELQRLCLNWMEDYKSHCVRLSLDSPPPEELAMRRELFGTSVECLILIKRIIATVSDQDREVLETETQALAHLLLELQEQPSPKFSWLFAGHEVGIAYAAIHTKDQWEGSFKYDSEYERRIATRDRYNSWSNMMRRYD